MSYQRMVGHPPGYKFCCDSCPPEKEVFLETGRQDFAMAVGAIRRAGWTLRRAGSWYLHVCPECLALGRRSSRETAHSTRGSAEEAMYDGS